MYEYLIESRLWLTLTCIQKCRHFVFDLLFRYIIQHDVTLTRHASYLTRLSVANKKYWKVSVSMLNSKWYEFALPTLFYWFIYNKKFTKYKIEKIDKNFKDSIKVYLNLIFNLFMSNKMRKFIILSRNCDVIYGRYEFNEVETQFKEKFIWLSVKN